jgi:hypothetical protein
MATNYLKTENQTAALSCAEAQWLLSSFEAPPFLDLFYLRHRSASLRQPTAFASGGRGSIFCEIFRGIPGILGIDGPPGEISWEGM